MKQQLVSQLSFFLSPGTIEVADLVTNNKSRWPLIGPFSSEHDLLNSSVAQPAPLLLPSLSLSLPLSHLPPTLASLCVEEKAD